MQDTKKKHVFIGLSGGVDSAVAALLLLEQGYQVTGLFMKNWEEDDKGQYCAAAEDLEMARRVSDILSIPLKAVNFSSEYWDRVFRHFLDEYEAGRTPNPDVLCNKEIKFRAFLEHALSLGADYIATGHYTRIRRKNDRYQLLQGKDIDKDQSYFLYTLGQEQLQRVMFPIGGLSKQEVRARAREANLPNHDRKDSTGICFIGERDFRTFLNRYLPTRPGLMTTLAGEQVGRHDGIMFYTLGQRHGLRIGGPGEAWYVVGKDTLTNTLYVEQGELHPALYSHGLCAHTLHWVAGTPPPLPAPVQIRTRHRQAPQTGHLSQSDQNRIQVDFDAPQRAVTPGQSVVIYDQEICLGGGVIEAAEKAATSPYHRFRECPTLVR